MNCNMPTEWNRLKKREQDRIVEAFKQCESKDMAILIRQMLQMCCCILYDGHGMKEEELTCFLGTFKQFFRRQANMVKDGTQIQELERRMQEIFPLNGFPDDFFASFLADWEKVEQ